MKKYKKYIDNTEYEFVPYSNNPQYAMGGTNDTNPKPKKSYTPIPLSLTANWEPSSVDSAIAWNYDQEIVSENQDPFAQDGSAIDGQTLTFTVEGATAVDYVCAGTKN